jgi:HSP20 family protein
MLVKYFDPFKEIREFERQYIDRYNKEREISGFSPKVNTREGEFAYHLDVDLPGIAKEDVHVTVDNDKLTISGERNFKEEVKEEDYYKVETRFGKFSRTFNLPENSDVENISASSDNGVLEVTIPKVEEKQQGAQRITVN